MTQNEKEKPGDVYLVSNKHRAGFTPDLCTWFSPPPFILQMCWICYSSVTPVSNTPICFSVNCTPLSCGLFHLSLKGAADKAITIISPADRRLFRLNKHWFQRANWLICDLILLYLSFKKKKYCQNLVPPPHRIIYLTLAFFLFSQTPSSHSLFPNPPSHTLSTLECLQLHLWQIYAAPAEGWLWGILGS